MYQKAHRYLIEFFITVVIALILTMLIRTFIAEAREIPTGSMLPAIQVGDIIMVEKVSVHFAPPSREDYIKRVVALPGDNCNHSFDSRNGGFLPIKNLKGTAWFRFWPFERAGSI